MLTWLQTRVLEPLGRTGLRFLYNLRDFWRQKRWHRAVILVFLLVVLILGTMYGIAEWYKWSNRNKPFTLGVTFIPDYARSLDLNAEQTMDALIDDLGVKRFRLTSYWNKIEAQEGTYDFSDLDWQFKKAEAAHAKISLAVGLRQPRWPECHLPDWAKGESADTLQPKLDSYISAVVKRYRHSKALESYQLENEYFNDFGLCPNHDRQRLIDEFAWVKDLDSSHPIIVSKSNNFPGGAFGKPRPDIVGVSVYRRVWDAKVTHNYFTYPLPAWYYGFNAGVQKILTHRESIIHELQMEPWPPDGKFIGNISLQEQDKSMNASMFKDRVEFAKNTGMKQADLWGAEWWYWRMVKQDDPSVWNEAKKAFQQYN